MFVQERQIKQKIHDEMAKLPCTSECNDPLSTVKADAEKAHTEVLQAISLVPNSMFLHILRLFLC